MLSRINPLDKQQEQDPKLMMGQQAQDLLTRCEQGDKSACQQIQGTEYGQLLQGGAPVGGMSQKLADGGEAGFMAEEEYTEEGMEEVDPFLPLMDLLGEEGFAQLQEAMLMHPIVAEVAMMATKTSDGVVSGQGGPKDDQVPALLSDGEFVMTAEAVEMFGVDTFEQMNEDAARSLGSQI